MILPRAAESKGRGGGGGSGGTCYDDNGYVTQCPTNVGMIVGIVIGCLVFAILVGYFVERSKKKEREKALGIVKPKNAQMTPAERREAYAKPTEGLGGKTGTAVGLTKKESEMTPAERRAAYGKPQDQTQQQASWSSYNYPTTTTTAAPANNTSANALSSQEEQLIYFMILPPVQQNAYHPEPDNRQRTNLLIMDHGRTPSQSGGFSPPPAFPQPSTNPYRQ